MKIMHVKATMAALSALIVLSLFISGIAVAQEARFSPSGSNKVIDKKTGLMWLKDADFMNQKLPLQVISSYIKEMNSGERENYGHKDWRVPTVEEMLSLVDSSRLYPAMPAGHPFDKLHQDYYWTATGGMNIVNYVWIMDTATGAIKYDYVSYCNFHYIMPVRSTDKAVDLASLDEIDVSELPSDVDFLVEESRCMQQQASLPPGVPLGISASAISPNEIVIVWQADETRKDIAWYNIYEGDKFVKSEPRTTSVIGALSPGTQKCFSIASYSNDGMESNRSKEVCATTWNEFSKNTVWAFGLNNFGQLGDGTRSYRNTPVQSGNLSDMVKVVAGVEHAAAIGTDGSVWTWGRNDRGQLGDGSQKTRIVPYKIEELSDVVDIAAGWYHTVALKKDGTVWAWGRNYYGQLGNDRTEDSFVPVKVLGLKNVKKIAAGWYHAFALLEDGTLASWGWNHQGQLGNGEAKVVTRPSSIPNIENVIDVAGGMYHGVALTADGKVYAWGSNEFGQVGDGTLLDTPFPLKVQEISDIINVECGMHYSLALRKDGTVWAWGRNDYGQIGTSVGSVSEIPVKLEGLYDIKTIAAGAHHAIAVRNNGEMLMWGWDYGRKLKNTSPTVVQGVTGVSQVSAGVHFTTLLLGDKE